MQSLVKWPKDVLGEVLYWCNLYDLIRLSCTGHEARKVLDNLSRYWWQRYFSIKSEQNERVLRRIDHKWNIHDSPWIAVRVLRNAPTVETPFSFFNVLNNLNDPAMVRSYLDDHMLARYVCFRLLQTQNHRDLWQYEQKRSLMFEVLLESRVSYDAFCFWKARQFLYDENQITSLDALRYYFSFITRGDALLCWQLLLRPQYFTDERMSVYETALQSWAHDTKRNVLDEVRLPLLSFIQRSDEDCSAFVEKLRQLFEGAEIAKELYRIASTLTTQTQIRNTTGFNQLLHAFSAARATDGAERSPKARRIQ